MKIRLDEKQLEVLKTECTTEGAEPESDVYGLGMEPGGPSNYGHVTPLVQESTIHYDLSEIGTVSCTCDFDEDDYAEWLADSEMTDSEETRKEYIENYVDFDVEYTDSETFHNLGCETMSLSEMEDYFGEKLANDLMKSALADDGDYFEVVSYIDDSIDANNLAEQEAYALKVLKHGEYFKGARGFVLTDGQIVYTESEHNMITIIPGIETKFDAVYKGWIRLLPNSIDIGAMPTLAQKNVLRQVISTYADEYLYVDLFRNHSQDGVKYNEPDYRRVIADIERFFEEGMSPVVNENIDLEFAPSDVDLSSFRTNNELNQKIWDGTELKSIIRLKLLDIADDFFESLNIKWIKPKDIILTGSICNFNWSRFSDIDLHIVVDFSEVSDKTELVQSYFDAKKNEWNQEHTHLEMMGFPVELYVQDINAIDKSDGIYSLEKNKWLSIPKKETFVDIEEVSDEIKDMAAVLMTYVEDCEDAFENTDDKHQMEELLDDMDEFTDKMKQIRQFGLSENGETSAGNVVYKILRREGFLDRAYELRVKLYDRINSI